jgi:hypothetical protein
MQGGADHTRLLDVLPHYSRVRRTNRGSSQISEAAKAAEKIGNVGTLANWRWKDVGPLRDCAMILRIRKTRPFQSSRAYESSPRGAVPVDLSRAFITRDP